MDSFKAKLQKPDIVYWPEVRWWLAEGFHTDKTLKTDIQLVHDAGFGATEFLAMDEAGADSSKYGWGSEEWVHDSQLIIQETAARKMGASMTSGTNWSNANLTTIVPDDKAAAKELNYLSETLTAGQSRSGALPIPEITEIEGIPGMHSSAIKRADVIKAFELIAVVAAKRVSSTETGGVLDEKSLIVLTGNVQGSGQNRTLDWTAPADGDYELFVFWMHGTAQTASPSVSVSYTVNYIDRYGVDALIDYWNKEVLTPDMRKYIKDNGRVQMYMDSLELSTYGKGGQFWGYHLLEEFQKRRGYDLTPYLPFVLKMSGMMGFGPFRYYYEAQDAAFMEKVRIDLYQTMTDLYMESMLKPMQSWLHSVGMTLRAEISYGLPFEISQPGKYVDGIETESLEFASQVDSFRNLAGPAHLYDRIYSSETGATMMNYMMGLDFYTQIIFTQFASGVTRTVLHGYSSIAGSESTYWPGHEGMWPMFSERFGVRQPAFQHYNDWTDMLARYQMLLREGKPRMDVGILRLDYNFFNMVAFGSGAGSEREIYETRFLRGHKGIYWQDTAMQDAGYTYDYFAPTILEEDFIDYADGVGLPGYQALVIYQEALPVSSAKVILEWAKKGLPVVFVNQSTELVQIMTQVTHEKAASKTPFNDGKDGELAAIVAEMKKLPNVKEIDNQPEIVATLAGLGVQPRAKFAQPNQNVLTLMREDGDVRYLYVYNYMYTDKTSFDCSISVDCIAKPYRIDCWAGSVEEMGLYRQENGRTVIDVNLAPGEAAMFMFKASEKDAVYAVESDACEVLKCADGLAILACESGTYTTKLNNGAEVVQTVQVPANVALTDWSLTVEDWNEGDKVTIHEDRGLGLVTDEVYYETKKTLIEVGKTLLVAWKDIASVGGDVSGVGYYSTTFELPQDWNEGGDCNGAYLDMESTNGCSVAVYVNGTKTSGVDFDALRVDVSELLKKGENCVKVEVSSTLNNRMKQRGYYDKIPNMAAMMDPSAPKTMQTATQAYGLTGTVQLVTYTVKKLG